MNAVQTLPHSFAAVHPIGAVIGIFCLARDVKAGSEAVEKLGIGRHALYFKTAADDHEASAKRWVIAVLIGGVVTVGAAILNFGLAEFRPTS